jgi:hypothetical protein
LIRNEVPKSTTRLDNVLPELFAQPGHHGLERIRIAGIVVTVKMFDEF